MKKTFASIVVFAFLGCGGDTEVKSTDPKLAPGTQVDPRIKLMTTKSQDAPGITIKEK
jgi:hypothetical protein